MTCAWTEQHWALDTSLIIPVSWPKADLVICTDKVPDAGRFLHLTIYHIKSLPQLILARSTPE